MENIVSEIKKKWTVEEKQVIDELWKSVETQKANLNKREKCWTRSRIVNHISYIRFPDSKNIRLCDLRSANFLKGSSTS